MIFRTRASVSPRQSPNSLIRASIKSEGEAPPFATVAALVLFFMVGVAFVMVLSTPLWAIAAIAFGYPLVCRALSHLAA